MHDTTPQLGLFNDEPVSTPPPTDRRDWWQRLPTADRIEQTLEWSAHDPDAEHPPWMREQLAGACREGWSKPPAPVVAAAPVPKTAAIELDLFAATPMTAQLTEAEALDEALSLLANALARKGEVPTMDDCHRRRFGLPGMSVFNVAGGWHAVVVRFRAELAA